MTENEQIQEMAKIVCNDTRCKTCIHHIEIKDCNATVIAKQLYSKGYRKVECGEWRLIGNANGGFCGVVLIITIAVIIVTLSYTGLVVLPF